MASSPITSLQIDGETVETVADFIFLGSWGSTTSMLKKMVLTHGQESTKVADG